MEFSKHQDFLWRFCAAVFASIFAIVLSLGVSSCAASDANVLVDLISLAGQEQPKELVHLQEVAPPPLIETLRTELDRYQPQIKITAPAPGEVLQQTTANVSFEVEDYPLFKNPEFGLGPHIHVFLDDQPYTAIYSIREPLVLADLAPGTHTLRAFASRPWHESFKNEGAYAQVTFHVLTETGNNAPDPQQPLLTYSRPQGSYGAEPIMLDFYLTHAPLHFLASNDPADEIPDWRIRATINDESFLIDRWEPIYLTGFKEGENWVKLEFLGTDGEPISNVFNTTARLIDYTPNGEDGLSRLVRGEVSVSEALAIVQPPTGENVANVENTEPTMTESNSVVPEASEQGDVQTDVQGDVQGDVQSDVQSDVTEQAETTETIAVEPVKSVNSEEPEAIEDTQPNPPEAPPVSEELETPEGDSDGADSEVADLQ